jgi:hypothetical protein
LVTNETSAWKVQGVSVGTGTVIVPEAALLVPTRVPCHHRFRVHVEVFPLGTVKVAWVLESVGGTGAAKAGAARATVMAETPAKIARRRVMCPVR